MSDESAPVPAPHLEHVLEAIEAKREDTEFMARIKDSVERHKPLLDKLAAPRLEDVLEEIKAERDRAEAKFPDQHLPNFPAATDFERQRAEMRGAQQLCERAHKAGEVTWWHVLREEACEAFAESDPAKLRAELLQVAAMSVRWIEDLDRAVLSPPVGTHEKPWQTNCTYHGTCPQPDVCETGCRGPEGAVVGLSAPPAVLSRSWLVKIASEAMRKPYDWTGTADDVARIAVEEFIDAILESLSQANE